MHLTLGQVRGILHLSQDAYRHWKTVLPPLATRNGHRPSYSHGDLLALAIVKSLTDEMGVPVGTLSTVALPLFEQCGQQSWAKFERLAVTIQPRNGNLLFVPEGQIPSLTGATIIVPCFPIIAALRAALMLEQPAESQRTLIFPLVAVTPDRRNLGGDKT